MIYFSQLDLIHILERALRRTDLPIYFTQGYNPHVKISFRSGLKLGVTGKIEVVLYFSEKVDRERAIQKLKEHLPMGLNILKGSQMSLKEINKLRRQAK
ncbi:MAG: DUF2344 domain-containing protein [Candidatus Omnitrophota bacterium]|nr:MAG: DUF2344 domain-containing protein [Candidatus Omnitrophota bacterium]